MSESLQDVYKARETWEQEQMGAGNESTFYIKKKNTSSVGRHGKKYFIGIAQYKDSVELELMKYSLPCSRIYYTELGHFTVLSSVR